MREIRNSVLCDKFFPLVAEDDIKQKKQRKYIEERKKVRRKDRLKDGARI